ncbi:hypothetical protein RI129_002391 [Pyrocoelia pectoralis]|uniref:Uncharacterized protein n=1 Tax=Pyrocoelia pectoralis TaxID=417401 RepID=A0AAN7VIW3_9COLE
MPELFHLDDFDRCLMLGKNALYCTVQMQIAPIRNASNSRVWKIIQETISNVKNYRHDWLRYGICIPQSCPNMGTNISNYINNETSLRNGIDQCYSSKLQKLGLTSSVMELHCETEKPFYEIDCYDTAVAADDYFVPTVLFYYNFCYYYSSVYRKNVLTFGFAFLNVFIAAAYTLPLEGEGVATKNVSDGKIVACFSIPKNWERLKGENIDPNAKGLKCINGIRFYTMLLVVMAHACMVGFIAFASNPKFGETMTLDPLYMLFLNGNYSMQIFLIISGWLLSYNFFIVFEKQAKFKPLYILYAFIHRYIR